MARCAIEELSPKKRPLSSGDETDVANGSSPNQISESFSESRVNLQPDRDTLLRDLERLAKVFDDVREKRPTTSTGIEEDETPTHLEPTHRNTDTSGVKGKKHGNRSAAESRSKQAPQHSNVSEYHREASLSQSGSHLNSTRAG
ncbi:hypothetical protein PGT21_007080 [Puccinia graminis f. sp. tritici]|uniref:Uncharacterized protein n=1 Tax=Puccinia graminis f. sp. tritici TaxID=56615 RepID=A0A5B0RDH6_PUCGR|nr:hypothetical protein PGT21_007080 [Puccinia graminis f. sp. tritici]KAA1123103.1 hypothetical protein PGTUg99_007414 [Puccinia graminis f. sp. tritici]